MPEKKKDKKKQAAQKLDKQQKKQLKQQQQRQKRQKQLQAQADQLVNPIYRSGLSDAYKFFLQQLYRQGVRFNIYQYAAQKMLKYEKIRKQKAKKIQKLNLQD